MMVATVEYLPKLTPTEYLDWEEQQELRYEYVNGEIYGMAGGTLNHSRIGGKIYYLLQNHLQGGRCQVLNSDAKVQIKESKDYVYPDVSVTCDAGDFSATQFIANPCLVVEVLSPGTEAYDRGDKFALYRSLTSLQEYMLVSSKKMSIDLYQRTAINKWELTSYGAGETIELQSIDLTLLIDRVFEDVSFVANTAESL
jgi:Uma2 family endonuclease